MSYKYLYLTLHIAFAYLDTFWSAYNQEKKKNILPKLFRNDLVKHFIFTFKLQKCLPWEGRSSFELYVDQYWAL